MEIAYSRFERVLELPCDLGRAEIETTYRDGMLFVHIRTGEGDR
jgi:HSP20 family molecular chaperone IbpA